MGKLTEVRETNTGVVATGRKMHGSPRDNRSRTGESVSRQKRKEIAVSVPARNVRARVCARTLNAVAEVGRRHQVSNKLRASAPKRVAAYVNGDLARCNHRR